MKILPITLTKTTILKTAGIISAAMLTLHTSKSCANGTRQETFVSADSLVTPKGELADSLAIEYPSSIVKIAEKEVIASVVVDLSKNILYKYDENGLPAKAYLVASGKESMPTHACLKRVTHIESYPYKSAPKFTKRYKYPNDYGPKIIFLEIIDPDTGKVLGTDGEFIHGNHDPECLGKYVSKGCIRMDNEAIKELAGNVKRGDYVVFAR